MAKKTFSEWMKAVDAAVAKKTGGLTSGDLADICYSDYYEDGMSAAAAAKLAIQNELG